MAPEIWYQNGHIPEGGGDYVTDFSKKVEVETIAELIGKIQEFIDEHPNAKIESGGYCLPITEYHEDGSDYGIVINP